MWAMVICKMPHRSNIAILDTMEASIAEVSGKCSEILKTPGDMLFEEKMAVPTVAQQFRFMNGCPSLHGSTRPVLRLQRCATITERTSTRRPPSRPGAAASTPRDLSG